MRGEPLPVGLLGRGRQRVTTRWCSGCRHYIYFDTGILIAEAGVPNTNANEQWFLTTNYPHFVSVVSQQELSSRSSLGSVETAVVLPKSAVDFTRLVSSRS